MRGQGVTVMWRWLRITTGRGGGEICYHQKLLRYSKRRKGPILSLLSGSLLFLSRSRFCAQLRGGDLGPLGQHSGFLGTHGSWGLCKTLRTHLNSLTRRLVTVYSIQPPGSSHSLWHFQPSVLLTGAALQRAGRGPPSTHPWGRGHQSPFHA